MPSSRRYPFDHVRREAGATSSHFSFGGDVSASVRAAGDKRSAKRTSPSNHRIFFEEIAQHVAAGRFIGRETDKPEPRFRSPEPAARSEAPDLYGCRNRLVDALQTCSCRACSR